MQIRGFDVTQIPPSNRDYPDICQSALNGITLSDYTLIDPYTPKDILSKAHIAQYSRVFQVYSPRLNFFLSTEIEEGKVHKDKSPYGFTDKFPSNTSVIRIDEIQKKADDNRNKIKIVPRTCNV
jgi:hypothetical protein